MRGIFGGEGGEERKGKEEGAVEVFQKRVWGEV